MEGLQLIATGGALPGRVVTNEDLSQLVDTSQITIPSVGMRMALAVIGVLPILVMFPLLQKHLIKGIVVGAVKG